MNELDDARERLKKAALAMPLNPMNAGISAYLNSILQSARTDALFELYLNPPNASWSAQEAIDAALLRSLTAMAEQLEQAAYQARTAIQIAPAMPPTNGRLITQ